MSKASDGVSNDQLRVAWSENGAWLWYERERNDGSDESSHIKVDAQTGQKFPLYDPQRLAAALALALAKDSSEITVAGVRVLRISDDGKSFLFSFDGRTFECSDEYALSPSQFETAFEQLMTRRSRSGASRIEMQWVVRNELDQPLALWWLSTGGDASAYGVVEPGESYEQHTFAGHIWSFRTVDGDELLRIATSNDHPELAVTQEWIEAYAQLPTRSNREGRGNRRNTRTTERGGLALQDFNLWMTDTTGNSRKITQDGTADRPYRFPLLASPSGKYLAVIQEKVIPKRQISIIESSPSPGSQPIVQTFDYPKPGDDLDVPVLRLFHAESGEPIRLSEQVEASDPFENHHSLMDNPWSLRLLDWTTSPERILCLMNQRGHQHLRVLAIDPSNGSVQVIVDESSPTFIDYAHKTFCELINDNRELIWMSERTGFNHLFKFDTSSGDVLSKLTLPHLGPHGLVRDVEQVDTAAGCIWFSASGLVAGQDPYFRHLCRVDVDGENFVRITDGDGDHRWEFSPDRRFVIDRYSRVDMPTVTTLRKAADGSLICELERADFSELVESGWTIPETFVAKGRDGQTDIYGVIVRPTGFDPNMKYPILEKVYAGPQSAYVPKGFSRLRQEHELADMGCIVVMVDGMGTSHRGKAFHDVCWKNLADAGFLDRIAWIKSAAEKYPELDRSRVGIFGGSAGGQNAMRALIDHHDFYQVAVADCGCHDNRMDKIWWNEAWMGWPIDDSYARSSNVDHAHRTQGKLLLIVGELDRNVDPASTMQVVDALVKADKDFELLVIPGAGHGAAESPYGSRRRADFIKRHLIDQQPRE